MALFKEDDKRHKYHYSISELQVLINDEVTTLPSTRIVDMEIIHDYTSNLFPIFRLNLVLESSVYYNLLRNKNNAKIHLRLQKYFTEIGKDIKSLSRDVFNTTFDLILDDDEFYADESLVEKEASDDYKNIKKDDVNDLEKVDNEIELFSYKVQIIQASKTMVNAIIEKGTTADAIAYIITKAKLPPVLMAPTDNKTEYNELIIPPLPASDAIQFIDSYYGLYKKGSMIYFDFDKWYILPYTGECKAYTRNEIREITIIIPSKTSYYSSDTCSLVRKNNDKMYYIIASNYTTPKNNANTQGVILGNEVISVDVNDGSISEQNTGGTSVIERIQVLDNKTENPYFIDTYTNQSKIEDTVIELFIADYDMSIIAPNKKVTVVFEDTKYTQKYKGTYLIASVHHTFTKTGADFKLASKIIVKKTN